MLTVDYDRLVVEPGDRVLDLGCGAGRHAYGAARRGADVVALDYSLDEVSTVRATFAAMTEAGEIPIGATTEAVRGDLLALPFPDDSFDKVIAAEVLEHIPSDERAMAEIARVLKPGGRAAVTVPRWLPERICWALSQDYHSNPGGHIRIYTGTELTSKLSKVGLYRYGSHHAHGLHAPYWWLKCAVGVERDHLLPRLYHRILVWDITAQPAATRVVDRALNPIVGKSLVVYLHKPEASRVRA
ncbi:MAG: methyltransferase domain-containing protein [Actinomycetes bacterium]